MSYQVLARKWRPRTFNEMVGQEHILRMLSNALNQQRMHHAYLFTGTRGVGKTTIARILAKCLNCETAITATPCGQCHACQAIDRGQFLDLYEVDAASRTKVEDTRDLLENVLYAPTQGRYKVYLIDEVHMLSNHSFNALLKTLEEPPAHVKFLLATTDPKKLPATILSRCLQFHLNRISPEQISQQLQHICVNENVPHEPLALQKLAQAADGSMRDALSLLDQAIAYGQGAVKYTDIQNMLGVLSHDDLLPLINALANHDGKALFAALKALNERGSDFHHVLDELIQFMHQLAIIQIVPEAMPNLETVKQFTKRFSAEEVQLYYQIAILSKRDLAYAASPSQGFEMAMLRMLAFKPQLRPATSAETITEKSSPIVTAKMTSTAETITEVKTVSETTSTTEPATLVNWRDILAKLELNGMAYALAANCSLVNLSANKVELALAANHQPMLNPKLKERINEALTRYFNQPMQLEIKISTTAIVTPQKQQDQERDQRLSQAKQNALADPQIQKLIDMYDATIEVSLVN